MRRKPEYAGEAITRIIGILLAVALIAVLLAICSGDFPTPS